MTIHFYKYQGAGNDFILLDNRNWLYTVLTTAQIKQLCDRRFGIGADGLMMLNKKDGYDFEMKYFNADGKEGSMCGNGGRCIVKFASHLGIGGGDYHFLAVDGPHDAAIDDQGTVNLKMKEVDGWNEIEGDYVLNTGSPHYVRMVSDVMDLDVVKQGMDIRYNETYARQGINVNFVELKSPEEIMVRTYERGVEDETLSCGTGVTASALVCYHNEVGFNQVKVQTRGGRLLVKYDRNADNSYHNIWLCGPAERVYKGSIEI
jgi:diaminopimelate epimerase